MRRGSKSNKRNSRLSICCPLSTITVLLLLLLSQLFDLILLLSLVVVHVMVKLYIWLQQEGLLAKSGISLGGKCFTKLLIKFLFQIQQI